MALTIHASSLFVKRYLTVKDDGVVYMETAVLGGRRKFAYGQIDHVLLSQNNVLSFQVGNEVFSLQTKPGKAKHQLAIQKFRESVAASVVRSVGFPVVQPTGVR